MAVDSGLIEVSFDGFAEEEVKRKLKKTLGRLVNEPVKVIFKEEKEPVRGLFGGCDGSWKSFLVRRAGDSLDIVFYEEVKSLLFDGYMGSLLGDAEHDPYSATGRDFEDRTEYSAHGGSAGVRRALKGILG